MKLINIGFGNMVASSRLIAIVSPESAPVKRTVQEARDRGMVVDGTYGRRTRAVLIMDSGREAVLLDLCDDPCAASGRKGRRTVLFPHERGL